MTRLALAALLVLAAPAARAQCEGPSCPDANALRWPDLGDRPDGALNPRRVAAIDLGFLATGAILFASGYVPVLLWIYAREQPQVLGWPRGCAPSEPGWALIPLVGGFIAAATNPCEMSAPPADHYLYGFFALPFQAVGLVMAVVALVAPSTHATVYDEGPELSLLPAAPAADAGLSLRVRW